MEIKINSEIREYTEAIYFGLSLRQFVFSVLAAASAVAVFFLLGPYLGTETVSWVCVATSVPFIALGFVRYHGMTAEQFLWAWLRSEIIEPSRLANIPRDLYFEILEPTMKRNMKAKRTRCFCLKWKHPYFPGDKKRRTRKTNKEDCKKDGADSKDSKDSKAE